MGAESRVMLTFIIYKVHGLGEVVEKTPERRQAASGDELVDKMAEEHDYFAGDLIAIQAEGDAFVTVYRFYKRNFFPYLKHFGPQTEGGPPPSAPLTPSEELILKDSKAWSLLHRLWSKSVGQPDYVKSEWKRLEEVVLGVARKEEDSNLSDAEAAAIRATHPSSSGRHDLYAEALRLVGARHQKGELVDLVTWLLWRIESRHLRRG
jgi:hypothetical protein